MVLTFSAYYRSSTIDNEEIHSVSSSTSNSDYEFGVIDFGPDSNDNPFILQRNDYAFYWGRYDSSSGFNYQSLSGGSQPLLYNIMGEIGHQIQDDVPQVGIILIGRQEIMSALTQNLDNGV